MTEQKIKTDIFKDSLGIGQDPFAGGLSVFGMVHDGQGLSDGLSGCRAYGKTGA